MHPARHYSPDGGYTGAEYRSGYRRSVNLLNRKKVALITESHTCIPEELRSELGITILPFTLVMDGVEMRDGVDITPQEFYRRLPELNGQVVRTASVSPGAYLQTFRERAEEAESILVMTIAHKLSASYQSAVLAAEQFKEIPVRVLDSGSVGSAQALAVLETAKHIREGADLDEAYDFARRVSGQTELYAYIFTFDYLRRSGHVPNVAGLLASALSIKPVLRFKNGDAMLVSKRPNIQKAKKDIVKKLEEAYQAHGPLNIIMCHANDPENCADLEGMIRAKVATGCVLTTEFTPVMGAHTGPGVVGAAFLPVLGSGI